MDETVKPEDRLKIYMAMVETSRKWVSVMDTKAGFLSGLNALLLGYIWTGAKLIDSGDWTKGLAMTASAISIVSLFAALQTVIPRESLKQIFGGHARYTKGHKAISFYRYVAENYPKGEEHRYISDVEGMDIVALCREQLEQQYTISHGLSIKSLWVTRAGWLLMFALGFTALALASKSFFD